MSDVSPAESTARRPNKRQQAKAATRSRVLAGAAALFRAGGYTETTIRGVARAIGMSTGAIFATVEDKAELWREAIGGPAPDPALGEEVALLQADHGQATWLLAGGPQGAQATILLPTGAECRTRGATPTEALRGARALADRVIQIANGGGAEAA